MSEPTETDFIATEVTEAQEIVSWHRICGVLVAGVLEDSPFAVELEKDVSAQLQRLDLTIFRREPGPITKPLPDGFEDLADHNLVSYKSLREPLDAWAIDELFAHWVTYRKLVSPSVKRLLPVESFRLYAISTRVPRKLRGEVRLRKKQPGVYEASWGSRTIRILVLSEMPNEPRNAPWGLLSGVKEKVQAAARQYQASGTAHGAVLRQLWELYRLEGMAMPYSVEEFYRDFVRSHVHELTPEERLRGLAPEERLRGLAPEERLQGLAPEERLQGLAPEERLQGLAPEERLRGLAPEERLQGLAPEERLQGLAPEERLRGLAPQEIVRAAIREAEQNGESIEELLSEARTKSEVRAKRD